MSQRHKTRRLHLQAGVAAYAAYPSQAIRRPQAILAASAQLDEAAHEKRTKTLLRA